MGTLSCERCASVAMDEAYVVDTSVYVRWFIDQVGFEHAREVRDAFLAGEVELISPDLARVEMANVLRKKGLLDGHLTRAEYLAAVRTLDDLGVDLVVQSADGIERAGHTSIDQMVNVYDATFVDLALQRGLPLLTGDARSSRAVANVVQVEVLRGVV